MPNVPDVTSFIIKSLLLQDNRKYFENFLKGLQAVFGFCVNNLYSLSKLLTVDSTFLPYFIRSLGVPKDIVDRLSERNQKKLLFMLLSLYKNKGVKKGFIPLLKAFIRAEMTYDEVYDFWWLVEEKALSEDNYIVSTQDLKSVVLYLKNFMYQTITLQVWRKNSISENFKIKIKKDFNIEVKQNLHLIYDIRTLNTSYCGVSLQFDDKSYLDSLISYQKVNGGSEWKTIDIPLSQVFDPKTTKYINNLLLFDNYDNTNILEVRNVLLVDTLNGRCYPLFAYRDSFIAEVIEKGENTSFYMKSGISSDYNREFINSVIDYTIPIGLSVEKYNVITRYSSFDQDIKDLYISDYLTIDENGEVIFPESFSYNNLIISGDIVKLFKIMDYGVSIATKVKSNSIIIINIAKSSLFNYYSVIFDIANERIQLYRYADGTSYLLAEANYTFKGEFFRFEVIKDTGNILISINGDNVINNVSDFISGYWELCGSNFNLKELTVFQIPNIKEVI